MNKVELWQFESELKELRDFLLDLQAGEHGFFYRSGFSEVKNMGSYIKGMEALDKLSRNYNALSAHVKSVERFVIFPKTEDLPKIEFSYGLAEVNAAIKVAVRQNRKGSYSFFGKALGVEDISIFSNKKYPLDNLHVEIERLMSAVLALKEREEGISEYESKEFQPAGISKDSIMYYINLALASVASSNSISPTDRKHITSLLMIIAEQISKNNTKWIQVIGALTLALTILQATAAAPDAFNNIKSAYDYLMSAASIESDKKFFISKNKSDNQLSGE